MMYIMLKELNAQFKISKHIYAIDLGIIVGFFLGGMVLKNIVYTDLQWVFFFFNLLVGFFMTAPSFGNPQKRNIQAMFILLRRFQNRRVYHALPTEYSSKDAIELRPSERIEIKKQ